MLLYRWMANGKSCTTIKTKELQIKRNKSNIKSIEGNIPTPYGIVNIKWNISADNGELKLDIPGGVKIKVSQEDLNISKKGIFINGKKAEKSSISDSIINLTAGVYQIIF